jgi:hypothetical protein
VDTLRPRFLSLKSCFSCIKSLETCVSSFSCHETNTRMKSHLCHRCFRVIWIHSGTTTKSHWPWAPGTSRLLGAISVLYQGHLRSLRCFVINRDRSGASGTFRDTPVPRFHSSTFGHSGASWSLELNLMPFTPLTHSEQYTENVHMSYKLLIKLSTSHRESKTAERSLHVGTCFLNPAHARVPFQGQTYKL